MRFTRLVAWASAGLLAACGAPAPSPSGAQAASVAGSRPQAAGEPGVARTWDEYRLRAARRIHAANPDATFAGPVPDPLQSIPVLQVKLNRDGSVRDIVTLRVPRQSPETVEMARRAIRRAAPFEPVGHLPPPWQFNETFLYDEQLRFQLRTLAEAP